MANKKSQHIFEVGELILPHPIIYSVWKQCEENDFGIVLEMYKGGPKHKDVRKVKIYWQQTQIIKVYEAHLIYHLHHRDQLEKEKLCVAEAAYNMSKFLEEHRRNK